MQRHGDSRGSNRFGGDVMVITDHAAERFIERIAPGTSMETARARLSAHADSAAKLKQKTHTGDAIYQSDSLKCRLVVRSSQRGEQERVVITVLPLEGGTVSEHEGAEIPEDRPLTLPTDTPGFDLSQVMQDLISGSSAMRTMVLSKLSREQLVEVRMENVKRTQEAIERGQRLLIQHFNGIAICVKSELRKHQPLSSSPLVSAATTTSVARSPQQDEQIRGLRRALGTMLFKYGWNGNEEAREMYLSVKNCGRDDATG